MKTARLAFASCFVAAASQADASPVAGRALQFNGVSQFVTIADSPELNLGSAATIEMWVRPFTPFAQYQRLLNKGDGANCDTARALELNIRPTTPELASAIIGDYFTGSTCDGWLSVGAPHTFGADEWIHVAMTHNAAQSRHRMFVNGVLVNERVESVTGQPATSSIRPTPGWPLLLGCYAPNALLYGGQMDEVRIWNSERTTAEIAASYNVVIPAGSTGLIGCYRFDESVNSQQVVDITAPASSGVLGSDAAVGFNDPTRVDSSAPLRGCQQDSNGDGVIDAADLSVLLGSFGQAVQVNTLGDLNADGLVNSADLSVLLGAFGSACGA
ncbi:MAG: hypothetical protein K1X67_17105 [Fimbriimonadaceae bacterium]|nr:hypothetical protein [Fimbriimonadaceae bacterium]